MEFATDPRLSLEIVQILGNAIGTWIGVIDQSKVYLYAAKLVFYAAVDFNLKFGRLVQPAEGVRYPSEVDVRGPHAEIERAVQKVEASLYSRAFAGLGKTAEAIVGGNRDI